MKKRLLCAIIALLLLFSISDSLAAGFSQNADAIEKAAQSVLMLYVYDSKDELIGTGSGFSAIDSTILITNYHVIEDANKVIATSDNGLIYTIDTVLCADKEMDVAIIGFNNPTNLVPLSLKADNNLKRGSSVVAIGSPEGLRNTVSIGNISYQFEEDGIPWIQFTAPISHGSSGGALLNDDGYVIGITSAFYQNGQNLNFAINISVALAMYNAWDGNTYTFRNYKSSAKLDFSNVYKSEVKTIDEANDSGKPQTWTCPTCSARNETRFCSECGTEKPIWICACGKVNNGKFCGDCGRSVAEMIKEINQAFSLMCQNNFADAISIFEQLEQFNCVSIETVNGKNIAAYEQLQAAYYEWAVFNRSADDDLDTVVLLFQKAEGYKDSEFQILKTYYDKGMMLFGEEDFENAIELFQKAGDYEDSARKIDEAAYLIGKKLYSSNSLNKAIDWFKKANHYEDADALILSSHYQLGLKYLSEKQYKKALMEFNNPGDYSDAKVKIKEIYYQQGLEAIEKEEYEKAKVNFTLSQGYLDAKEKKDEANQMALSKKYTSAEQDFNNGKYLSAAAKFAELNDYSDADTRELQCYYEKANQLLTEKQYIEASDMFKKAASYSDASYMVTEVIFLGLQNQVEEMREQKGKPQTYINVIDSLSKIKDENSHAFELYKELNYETGLVYQTNKLYESAIPYFENAEDYLDAKEKLYQTKVAQVRSLIDDGRYSMAYSIVLQEENTERPLGGFSVLSIGDNKNAVSILLAIAKGMEYLETYPKGETEYKARYENAIKRIEKTLNMEPDGIISLSEMVIIENLIYPSQENTKVKSLLEKLSDLDYLSALPDSHQKYESRYMYGIKKAEKELGLQSDGLITQEEYDLIMEQKVNIQNRINNIKTSVSESNVTITWEAVEGNVWYNVYRDSNLLTTTKDRRFVDKNVKTGKTYYYYVQACKYTTKGDKTKVSCYVDIYYKNVDMVELCTNTDKYIDDYVRISSLYKESQYMNGNDLYILCKKTISGKTYHVYLLLEDYYDWDWKDGKGIKDKNVISLGGKGTVSIKKGLKYNTTPVIILNNISWDY